MGARKDLFFWLLRTIWGFLRFISYYFLVLALLPAFLAEAFLVLGGALGLVFTIPFGILMCLFGSSPHHVANGLNIVCVGIEQAGIAFVGFAILIAVLMFLGNAREVAGEMIGAISEVRSRNESPPTGAVSPLAEALASGIFLLASSGCVRVVEYS